MFFDFEYMLWIAPALLLGLWAQWRVKSTYASAQQMPAPLSGAAAARHILDSAGLRNVDIEQIPGQLTDHYDPKAKVLRLSPEVYQGRYLAAVGIAAHESGHALQDAQAYSPLIIRNAAVPVASFGSGISYVADHGRLLFAVWPLVVGRDGAVRRRGVLSVGELAGRIQRQLARKAQLVELGIINNEELVLRRQGARRGRLDLRRRHAAIVMILLYYISLANRSSRD